MIVDLDQKFTLITEHWRPKIIASLNGHEVKLVKFKGEFVWHKHGVDELFFVWKGSIKIELRDGEVRLSQGQMFVVPRGVEHRPIAEQEAEILLIEPVGVVNTGDAEPSEFTAPTTFP